jgi:hypothetical protein
MASKELQRVLSACAFRLSPGAETGRYECE